MTVPKQPTVLLHWRLLGSAVHCLSNVSPLFYHNRSPSNGRISAPPGRLELKKIFRDPWTWPEVLVLEFKQDEPQAPGNFCRQLTRVLKIAIFASAALCRAPSRAPGGGGAPPRPMVNPHYYGPGNFSAAIQTKNDGGDQQRMTVNGPHIGGWQAGADKVCGAFFGNSRRILGS